MDLLDLPDRSVKPRQEGITHVIDRGLSIADVEGMIEVAGDYVDIVKLGWGTALATANLERKLDCYRRHQIPVVLGGTLSEIAISQGRLEQLVSWLGDLGLRYVEISNGTITLDTERKVELIRSLSEDFTVLSEVGSKDDTGAITAPYRWVEQIEQELAAGAWKVIAEGREAGTAGIFRSNGEVREGLIDEITHEVDFRRIVFDAPRKDQQVWFIRRFGSNVNLGNIAPPDVLSLETIRLGLRADTLGLGLE